MTRILVLLSSIVLATFITFGQEEKKYSELVGEALRLYQNKDYRNAGLKYSAVFKDFNTYVQPIDRWNASCSWARISEPDSAFKQLYLLAQNEDFHSFNGLKLNLDLRTLQSDKRWIEVIDQIKRNKIKAAPNLNYTLVEILDTVFYNDQRFRSDLDEIGKNYGWQSDEMKNQWKRILLYDSLNVVIITDILDKHGWLGSDSLGDEGNSTLFFVIQHADIKTQEKYLPMMRDAVKKGNAEAGSLALLEDRVALRQGKRQIYGSQISLDDETGKYYVMPLEDPDNVDIRRGKVGLGSLREYVSEWGIIWDAEKYKKFLQEFETKQHK